MLKKTRNIEVQRLTTALKAQKDGESRDKNNNDTNNNEDEEIKKELSNEALKKLFTLYPIHNKAMDYYRDYISRAKLDTNNNNKRKRKRNRSASSPSTSAASSSYMPYQPYDVAASASLYFAVSS